MMDMMYAGTLRTSSICMLLTACARCASARCRQHDLKRQRTASCSGARDHSCSRLPVWPQRPHHAEMLQQGCKRETSAMHEGSWLSRFEGTIGSREATSESRHDVRVGQSAETPHLGIGQRQAVEGVQHAFIEVRLVQDARGGELLHLPLEAGVQDARPCMSSDATHSVGHADRTVAGGNPNPNPGAKR